MNKFDRKVIKKTESKISDEFDRLYAETNSMTLALQKLNIRKLEMEVRKEIRKGPRL